MRKGFIKIETLIFLVLAVVIVVIFGAQFLR